MIWLLFVFLLAGGLAVALYVDKLPLLCPYAFFIRFPLLGSAAIVGLPFLESHYALALMVFTGPGTGVVTILAFLAAWACMVTGLVTIEGGHDDSRSRRFIRGDG